MKPALLAVVLILLLASLACGLAFPVPPLSLTPVVPAATDTPRLLLPTPTLQPSPLPPTETSLPPAATSVTPELTADLLRNATLTFLDVNQQLRTVTFVEGLSTGSTDQAQAGEVSIVLGPQIAFGDLDGDGLDDAALTLAENYGGTGVFVSLVAVLNQGGQPVVAASLPIDDRPLINQLLIENGRIFLDATVHGLADALCCATLATTRRYQLETDSLVLTEFASQVPDGPWRSLTLAAPAEGAELSGPFFVSGSVTVSPFENNLVYRLYLPGQAEPAAEGGFIISADGLGGPGVFDLPLDFSAAGFRGPVRLEILDLSPADGSLLSLAALNLTLK